MYNLNATLSFVNFIILKHQNRLTSIPAGNKIGPRPALYSRVCYFTTARVSVTDGESYWMQEEWEGVKIWVVLGWSPWLYYLFVTHVPHPRWAIWTQYLLHDIGLKSVYSPPTSDRERRPSWCLCIDLANSNLELLRTTFNSLTNTNLKDEYLNCGPLVVET